jgi:CHAT domain-containing protein
MSGLMLADSYLSLVELCRIPWQTDIFILNNWESSVTQARIQYHFNLADSLIQGGVKAVVLNLWRSNHIATAMLMHFLHQYLQAGQPVASALQQAQQQLRLVTVAQALKFCRHAQALISWQDQKNRAARAMLTKSMGDLLALGGDYAQATEAYGVAIQIFASADYPSYAKELQSSYRQYQQLSSKQNLFHPSRLIFTEPEYWTSLHLVGDCRATGKVDLSIS